ncbi:hypothetical protein BCR32DRAFT_284050 [Anaeromyces robustus]|uniref:Uncharacterized protein n=1 Tax=Anaeromyces robustus TaxID=1754192 RepID=A0A1Y1WTT0_9FUNG|nr:hypothetical protein BCR32DRAFT_284050 [Anaeromyces robustus]|eukprot:ORX76554.1 hypothetical protein BCR32DRAFT_284050 [Anaeromyces robustus]
MQLFHFPKKFVYSFKNTDDADAGAATFTSLFSEKINIDTLYELHPIYIHPSIQIRFYACSNGNENIVKYLIEQGAKINKTE